MSPFNDGPRSRWTAGRADKVLNMFRFNLWQTRPASQRVASRAAGWLAAALLMICPALTEAFPGYTSVLSWGARTSGALDVPADLTNAVQLVAGYNHVVAIKADGAMAFWGDLFKDEAAVLGA